MESRKFDDLTRALASGTTRRGVLKGALGGAIAGLFGRSHALAQDDCPGGKVDICHRTNSARNPYNYISVCSDSLEDHLAHGDTYCEGNYVLGDECNCVCGIDETTCEEGTTFNPETCSCDPDDQGNQPCETFVCGNEACAERSTGLAPNCYCFEQTESPGNGLCLGNFPCGGATSCDSNIDCPEGWTCVTNTCCGAGVQLCAPPCPPADATSSVRMAQSDGPTAGGQ